MPELSLHGKSVKSVFNLLGQKENDITFSIGWVLSRCPVLLLAFLTNALGEKVKCNPDELTLVLQDYQKGLGITDVEIRGKDLHLIIEAKRGWEFPSERQLLQYLPRFDKTKAEQRMIIAMSECSQVYAKHYLADSVKGVPVRHVSWQEMSLLTSKCGGTQAEKRLMEEFRNYIATIVNMQPQESNRVYIVSLSNEEFAKGLTFIQVVEKRRRYFHPYGTGSWPKEPPNYIAFRYDGKLQSIHHIEKAEVIRNFHPHFPERKDQEDEPHFLYLLGPAIRPAQEVRTGSGITRSARRWAFLDLLLTSKTITDACAASKKRTGQG